LEVITIGCVISISGFIPSLYVKGENDDDLAIREGETYVWIVSVFDLDKYKESFGSGLGIALGLKVEYSIEYIYRDLYYWRMEVENKYYKNNQYTQTMDTEMSIGIHGENYTAGKAFIRRDAEVYLKEWILPTNYTVTGLEVKFTDSFEQTEKIYVYQSNGIMISGTFKYKGEIVMQQQLTSAVISFGYYFLGFTGISILCVIFIFIRRHRGERIK
jgi:hypothetical protein